MDKYRVYVANSGQYYMGVCLIAAENADDANHTIKCFKNVDKDNRYDSMGILFVDEDDVLDGVTAETSGIIYNNITYTG